MDSIGNGISAYSEIDKGKPSSFNPENENLDRELTIIISGAQASFNTTNWYITIAVSVLGGILAYFVSGRALKSLKSFASQVENVQPNNLADMKISELTDEYIAEYLRAEYEGEEQTFSTIHTASIQYIKSYTGLTDEEMDNYEDLTIAALVLCGDMYDNRQMTVQSDKENPTVTQILALHSVNLL